MVDGKVKKKARLVARGYQQPSLEEEVYAPVARMVTLRVLLALAVENDLNIHQLDVRSAFLKSNLNEVVYMKPPDGLTNCEPGQFRGVLQKAKESGLHSVALPIINSVKRNYPPEEGAHIALRTVRRFLEHHGSSLETVIFVVNKVDLGIYEVLLPLYFPRSKLEEESARYQLPEDVGGPDGEPIVPDRQIRIIDNPQHTLHPDDESVDLSVQLETSITVGDHAFSQMQGDLDQQRLLGGRSLNDPLADIMVKEIQHQER
nr:ganglioside-induced differentiation-associated protein 2-like [Leptinotarsa decemlineata]